MRVGNTNSSNSKRELPLITIGMPIKNREWCIKQVLEAIEGIDYPSQRIKLVFVDNYSTDTTFEMLSHWKTVKESSYYDIKLIKEQGNIPHLRNICIANLEGEYMLFWDSDIVPPKDLLTQMIKLMEHDDSIGIIEPTYVPLRLEELKNINLFAQISKPMIRKAIYATGMGFTLIRKGIFEEIGGFNELLEVGEDTEFSIRAFEKTNHKITRVSRPVFHLWIEYKDKFIVRPHEGFLRWLKYNFSERGKHYAESFSELPAHLRFRILYYALLPAIIISSPFLLHYTGIVWTLLMVASYLLPGLSFATYSSNVRRGTISFFKFNIPTGVALSYGVLTCLFKKLLRR